jgi:site-specific DNA recombinase
MLSGCSADVARRAPGGPAAVRIPLIDAGPHPNPAKAADGKRLHALALDDPAATVVAQIFGQFIAGEGLFAIAESVTRDGIPCPSAHDPGRNKHRCGVAWSKGAVRAILVTPATPDGRSGTSSARARCSLPSLRSRTSEAGDR